MSKPSNAVARSRHAAAVLASPLLRKSHAHVRTRRQDRQQARQTLRRTFD